MPEHPRRKHRDGDDVGPLLGQQRDRLAERHLGGVPLAKLREAEKDLLDRQLENQQDRKSTRLNSSHGYISYAVFCLKKKKKETQHRLMNMSKKQSIHA